MTDKLLQQTNKLSSLIKHVESLSSSGHAANLLSEATSLIEEAESFNHGISSLSASADATVDDRLLFALKSIAKDWVAKADAAVKRELDKLTNLLIDEVRPFLSTDAADRAKDNVHAAAMDLEHAGDLEDIIEDYIQRRFRTKARNTYAQMLDTVCYLGGVVLDERITLVMQELGAVARVESPATLNGCSGKLPLAEPDISSVSPASALSSIVSSPVRPRTEPFPEVAYKEASSATASISNISTSALPAAPPRIDASSPVLASTDDGGPHETPSSPHPGTRPIAVRSSIVMGDLNRMLGAPPKLPRPKAEEDTGENGEPLLQEEPKIEHLTKARVRGPAKRSRNTGTLADAHEDDEAETATKPAPTDITQPVQASQSTTPGPVHITSPISGTEKSGGLGKGFKSFFKPKSAATSHIATNLTATASKPAADHPQSIQPKQIPFSVTSNPSLGSLPIGPLTTKTDEEKPAQAHEEKVPEIEPIQEIQFVPIKPKKSMPSNAMSAMAAAMRQAIKKSNTEVEGNSGGESEQTDSAPLPRPRSTITLDFDQRRSSSSSTIDSTTARPISTPIERSVNGMESNRTSLASPLGSEIDGPPPVPARPGRTLSIASDSGFEQIPPNSNAVETSHQQSSPTKSNGPKLPPGAVSIMPGRPQPTPPLRLPKPSGLVISELGNGIPNTSMVDPSKKTSLESPSDQLRKLSGVISSTPIARKLAPGDDRALEKNALEWLNQNLSLQNTIADSIYTFHDGGLNLIYALEKVTGESVGKYRKITTLQVQKIDNLSMMLQFLQKRGIDTRYVSPQDLLSEDKNTILTLYSALLKKFP